MPLDDGLLLVNLKIADDEQFVSVCLSGALFEDVRDWRFERLYQRRTDRLLSESRKP